MTFVAPSENRYIWASGTASIVEDPTRLKALWHGGYLQWLPGGPDDPSVTLIKVAVEEAEYRDEAAGRMVRLDSFIQPGLAFREIVVGVGIECVPEP